MEDCYVLMENAREPHELFSSHDPVGLVTQMLQHPAIKFEREECEHEDESSTSLSLLNLTVTIIPEASQSRTLYWLEWREQPKFASWNNGQRKKVNTRLRETIVIKKPQPEPNSRLS